MSDQTDSACREALEDASCLWGWNLTETILNEKISNTEVATIEYWKYEDDEGGQEGQKVPPTKQFKVGGFHTESMVSWLKEPIPAVNGKQPSSGFKMVAVPICPRNPLPDLTREQTYSINKALGLPNIEIHSPSLSTGACGMFRQSDGSYVFVLRKTADMSSIGTAVRYDPTTNVTRGVFLFSRINYNTEIFDRMFDQFMHCSHPLLLPLLAIEATVSSAENYLRSVSLSLSDLESQTGYGYGVLRGVQVKLQSDYRTLVRELGLLQSRQYMVLGTLSWCQICAEFLREKLRHLQQVLPEESRSRLESSHQMLDERVEFLLSNIKCAFVVNAATERMEAQQTVLFNLIAQSDNLINVGLAKDSKEMAVASKQDSSAMKIIALLTTFFLPGTFIASFFAMPLFDWSEPTLSRVANRHFWVYWAVTGPLTLTIMAGVMAWALWHNRYVERLQSRARDSVDNHSTGGKDQEKGKNQEPESRDDKGQDAGHTPETEAEKMGFRQKFSLHKVLNRRKRQSATVEAEP